MKRRLLSAFLAVMMVLTMAPVAFAADDAENTVGDTCSSESAPAKTLQQQIDGIKGTGTVTLDKDYTEYVNIPKDSNITLDLNGHKISSGTTTILNNGTLIVRDSSEKKNGVIESTGNVGICVGSNSVTTVEYANIQAKEGAVITSYATDATITIKDGVFTALDNMGMSEQKEIVKSWYDGFVFGNQKDIYNPWSITNYLDKKQVRTYWADTSSNSLISRLIRKASAGIKEQMEELLQGKEIIVNFDEQIVFEQLDQDENAIWSLMLASGYLKAEQVEYRGLLREPWYHLKITNLETTAMFTNLFKSWFNQSRTNYNQFIKALLQNDIDAMNYYMNQISMATFSYFDVDGVEGGKSEPERFYHGFVLGLIAEQTDIYEIRSNRESGFGRYDVMMIPKKRDNCYPAVIIEFKVHNAIKEANLEASVKAARKQIEEKNYDAELFARGFCKEGILHYGFAFEGKKVLIG